MWGSSLAAVRTQAQSLEAVLTQLALYHMQTNRLEKQNIIGREPCLTVAGHLSTIRGALTRTA